eukprot:TRINITY_DN19419_c0_g1_i1.p1 TRINITY_DN19419_c0_g1~~TRINITY_DN19419_c0_g1_i1.p1  ORF type:complete len:1103 (+),score=230.12 TRINITY_DN19419_c0_g1_i1:125-3433(+)
MFHSLYADDHVGGRHAFADGIRDGPRSTLRVRTTIHQGASDGQPQQEQQLPHSVLERLQKANSSYEEDEDGRDAASLDPADEDVRHMPTIIKKTLAESDPYRRLPRQLSTAVLDGLLQDLLEYNGITFNLVPSPTFRDKYVGLYFGKYQDAPCEDFVQQLKQFHASMSYHLECVLVSCDGTDDEWHMHARQLGWPTFQCNDYRVRMLRSHFEVDVVPKFVVLDTNGMVVTDSGVERIMTEPHKFPWCEPIFSTLWSEDIKGLPPSLLSTLGLPPYDGKPWTQFDLIGCIVGEPWCPDTQDLLRRVAYMRDQIVTRSKPNFCAFYFLHSEGLEPYLLFPDHYLPFPSSQLDSEGMRAALQHYLDVPVDEPVFFVTSPTDVWAIGDAAAWVRRDPTGIAFPWRENARYGKPLLGAGDDSDQAKGVEAGLAFNSVIQELCDSDLSSVLYQGPVFVALLQGGVPKKKAEVLADIRAVATAYKIRMEERERGLIDPEDIGLHRDLEEADERGCLGDRLRTASVMPTRGTNATGSLRAAQGPDFVKAERVVINNLDQALIQKERHTAMWARTCRLETGYETRQLSFFFCASNTASAMALQKFCHHEFKWLHLNRLWEVTQQLADADAQELRSELISKKQDILRTARDAEQKFHMNQRSRHTRTSRRWGAAGLLNFGPNRAKQDAATLNLDNMIVDEDDDNHGYDEDSERWGLDQSVLGRQANSHHHARREIEPLSIVTCEMTGDEEGNKGSAVIVDAQRGVYYVCGSLTDRETLVRFIDAWYCNALQAFDIGVVNSAEKCGEDELDDLPIPRSPPTLETRSAPSLLPVFVVWVLSAEHSSSYMSVGSLYRAILNYAYTASRSQDPHSNKQDVADVKRLLAAPDSELVEKAKKFFPLIERFWIFALRDGEEATAEATALSTQGYGCAYNFKPPKAPFLDDLRHMVEDTIIAAGNEDKRADRRQERGATHAAMTAGGDAWQSAGLLALRNGAQYCSTAAGGNLVLRMENTRRAIRSATIDEIAYATVVQCPPPPLSILWIGDLPALDEVFWPSALQHTHMHIIGRVPDMEQYRKQVTRNLTSITWEEWQHSCMGDSVPSHVARHVVVPIP